MNKQQRKRAKKLWQDQQRKPTNAATGIPRASPHKKENAKLTTSARPHRVTVVMWGIALAVTVFGLCWSIIQPDIRIVPNLGPEPITVIASKVDSAGNFVHNIRIRPVYTNFSIKPGYVDKADLVPLSIAPLPDIKVTSIDKTPIYWHQKKTIEIMILISIPTDPINNLNTMRALEMDQVLNVFDNVGRKIDLTDRGTLGRNTINFKQIVNVHVNPAP